MVGAVQRKTVTPPNRLSRPSLQTPAQGSPRARDAHLSRRHEHQSVGAITALWAEKGRSTVNEGHKSPDGRT